MTDREYKTINVPETLLSKLEDLVPRVNATKKIFIASKTEAVRRAIENYIEFLESTYLVPDN